MQILRVCDTETEKAFVRFPAKLYRENPYWAGVSHAHLQAIFDTAQNPFFQHGQAERWIITNFRGNMIGRIASFVDQSNPEQPVGGMGCFECIDYPKAAFAMFDQCTDWLTRRKVRAIQGPGYPSGTLVQGGVLTEGFQAEALYGMPYHLPYYQHFIEEYGFQLQHKRYHFRADLMSGELLKACRERAGALLTDPHMRLESWEKGNAGWLQILHNVCRKSKQHAFNFQAISSEGNSAFGLRPLLNELTAWVAYYKQEPVGILVCLTEPEGAYQPLRSSRKLINKFKALFQAQPGAGVGVLMLHVPAFQGGDIDAALLLQLLQQAQTDSRYRWAEISGGAEDTALINTLQALRLERTKTFQTYQYLISAEKNRPIADQQVSAPQVDAGL